MISSPCLPWVVLIAVQSFKKTEKFIMGRGGVKFVCRTLDGGASLKFPYSTKSIENFLKILSEICWKYVDDFSKIDKYPIVFLQI